MLSTADIYPVLYKRILKVDPKNPKWPERDRFLLSKGHGGAALLACLAECGFFPLEWLDRYYCDDGKAHRIIVMSSDGDLNEGSTWEAIMLAGQHHYDNLTMLVDYNRLQALGNSEDIINLEPLGPKLEMFGWKTIEADGHDPQAIENALSRLPLENEKPSCIIFRTVKGKGVSFMENDYKWHYGGLTPELRDRAIAEVEGK